MLSKTPLRKIDMKTDLLLPLLLTGLLAACSSGGSKGDAIAVQRSDFVGFPAQTLESIVYAHARFPADHERLLGVDLIDEENIIPVALTVRLRGKDQEKAQIFLSAEQMGLTLYLPDGTALSPVDVERVVRPLRDRDADRIRAQAFQPGLLGPESDEGFVFFKLAPGKDFRVDGEKVLHVESGIARPMILTGSLLAFNVTIEDHLEPFYVGLQR
jgi:hypothetical protein